jgi:hypothetical protein
MWRWSRLGRACLVTAVAEAGCRRTPPAGSGTFVQPLFSISEGELLDVLNERNHVAANPATEADKTLGTDVHEQVWTAAVRVERTPAD